MGVRHENLKCTPCNRDFSTIQALRNHENRSVDHLQRCEALGLNPKNEIPEPGKRPVGRPRKVVALPEQSNGNGQPEGAQRFLCKICPESFGSQWLLAKHRRESGHFLRQPKKYNGDEALVADYSPTRIARVEAPHTNGEHKNNGTQTAVQDNRLENAISYAFGHCEAWLQIYAGSVGVPASVLASRVSELLRRSTRG